MSKSDQWHGGKGSYRRNENKEAYESNWDRIFNKPKTEEETPKVPEESPEDRFERHMKPIREAQKNDR